MTRIDSQGFSSDPAGPVREVPREFGSLLLRWVEFRAKGQVLAINLLHNQQPVEERRVRPGQNHHRYVPLPSSVSRLVYPASRCVARRPGGREDALREAFEEIRRTFEVGRCGLTKASPFLSERMGTASIAGFHRFRSA